MVEVRGRGDEETRGRGDAGTRRWGAEGAGGAGEAEELTNNK